MSKRPVYVDGKIKITLVAIDKIVPYANNARKHSKAQIESLANSIKDFGFLNPFLLGEDDVLIAGHGRLEAAKKAGLTNVPCIYLRHLTEAQKKAYMLVDNRLAELSRWDEKIVRAEGEFLKDFFNMADYGFAHTVSEPEDDEAFKMDTNDFHGDQGIRKIHLFFDDETGARFLGRAEATFEDEGVDNLSDLMLALVNKAHEAKYGAEWK